MKKFNFLLYCLIFSGLFGQGIPYGKEFLVTTHIENFLYYPSVTGLTGGGFFVCWTSYEPWGSGSGIYGQLFEEDGSKQGGEFLLNTYTQSSQGHPSVTGLIGGGFVVCWTRYEQDGSGFGIYGQLFEEDGSKQGGEFLVKTHIQYYGKNPLVTGLIGGGFVVCLTGYGQDGSGDIYGQLFEVDGSKEGSEFLVNTHAQISVENPSVTDLTGGGFVVCWTSWGQDWSADIYGQLFEEDGSKQGGEFLVNTHTRYDQDMPLVTSLTKGGFVVCWMGNEQDGSGTDIYGQLFEKDGSKQGGEFLVNTHTQYYQEYPSVIDLTRGGFVVCWTSNGQDWSGDIYGQLFKEDGSKEGGEFLVNTYTHNPQAHQWVTDLTVGGFVVCWMSWEQDGSEYGIYAKRFPESQIFHPLVSFDLIGPAMDVTLEQTDVLLKWRQPSNQIVCYPWELHYKIIVDESPDFISPMVFEQDKDTTYNLHGLVPGTSYFWKVLAKNIDGDSLWSTDTNAFFISHTAEVLHRDTSPEGFRLYPNYPNPFNSETLIRFELPSQGFIRMSVYNIRGRLVRVLFDENRITGSYCAKWDGRDGEGNVMPTGIYICTMEVHTPEGRTVSKSVKIGLVR